MHPANASAKENFKSSKATEADIDDLEKLVNLAYRGGKATVSWKNEDHLVEGPRIIKKDLQDYLQSKDSSILILRRTSNEIVGTVQVEKHGNDAHIGMLSVHPDFQNFGLGKQLLLLGEDCARSEFSCSTAKMFVLAGREELLAWYRKMGYELTGETMPFFGPESGLKPKVANAHFVVVAKNLK